MLDQSVLMQALFLETGKSPLYRKWDWIVEWLGSDQPGERLAAEERLEQEGADAAKILHTIVQYDVGLYRSGKRWLQALMLFLVALCGLFLYQCTRDARGTWEAASYLIMPAWLAMPFVIALYDAHQVRKRRLKNTLILLYRYNVSQSVASLIELMEFGDAATSALAVASLTLLLPRLKASQGRHLTKRQHHFLCRALIGYNGNRILTVLAILEQFGQPTAIPHVLRLTECPRWVAENERIRAAARQCLVVLKRRAEIQGTARNLLRAASRSELSADSLLRPASSKTAAAPQHLLRACDKKIQGEREPLRDNRLRYAYRVISQFPRC